MFKCKTKKEKKTIQNNVLESETLTDIQAIESAVDNSFFYTNDKFFDQLDSTMIINDIIQSYPGFIGTNTDTEIKHEFLAMIQNTDYVYSLLEQYNLTLNEFLKILCKSYGSIFKGMFLRKVKTILELYEK